MFWFYLVKSVSVLRKLNKLRFPRATSRSCEPSKFKSDQNQDSHGKFAISARNWPSKTSKSVAKTAPVPESQAQCEVSQLGPAATAPDFVRRKSKKFIQPTKKTKPNVLNCELWRLHTNQPSESFPVIRSRPRCDRSSEKVLSVPPPRHWLHKSIDWRRKKINEQTSQLTHEMNERRKKESTNHPGPFT